MMLSPTPTPTAGARTSRRHHCNHHLPLLLLLLLALALSLNTADAHGPKKGRKKTTSSTCAALERNCGFEPGGGGGGGGQANTPWVDNDMSCTLASSGVCTCVLTNSGSKYECQYDRTTNSALMNLECPVAGGAAATAEDAPQLAVVQSACGPTFPSPTDGVAELDPWFPNYQNAYFDAGYCSVPIALPAAGATQELYFYVACAPRVSAPAQEGAGTARASGSGGVKRLRVAKSRGGN